MKRQPSLFKFEPTDTLRNSGLTPQEERELLIFCLAGNGQFPRTHRIDRTGTEYQLNSEMGAALLYKRLRKQGYMLAFGREIYREAAKRRAWSA